MKWGRVLKHVKKSIMRFIDGSLRKSEFKKLISYNSPNSCILQQNREKTKNVIYFEKFDDFKHCQKLEIQRE